MQRTTAGAVIALLTVAGIGQAGVATAERCPVALPQGSEPVSLDPADFVEGIDNPYMPLLPGSRWFYRETDGEGGRQRVRVTVTSRTREILGIDATVVHDKVTEGRELVENTFDWYAQDGCGNVWYLGENTKEYEDGQIVSMAGSWEAGVGGAQAGVVMPADPQVGLSYRQEYFEGEAEDAAEILGLDEQAEVRFGHFQDVLLTEEFTPIEPKVLELKLYAPGVGMVLAVGISGGSDREELVRFVPGP